MMYYPVERNSFRYSVKRNLFRFSQHASFNGYEIDSTEERNKFRSTQERNEFRFTQERNKFRSTKRPGVVLAAVLMVIAVLALAALQFSRLMTEELILTEKTARAAQSKALADSGIQYAMAVLADQSAYDSMLSGNPFDNPAAFSSQEAKLGSLKGRGRFRIIAPLYPEDGEQNPPYRYGVTDESGKLNLNTLMLLDNNGEACKQILLQLPIIRDNPDLAESIVSWMAPEDASGRSQESENEYYGSLPNPYHCKYGPLDSLEELLLVRGITPEILFGDDLNRSGIPSASQPGGDMGFSRGLSAYLTVYSREPNVDADGNQRININRKLGSQTDVDKLQFDLEQAFSTVDADGTALANFIVAARLNNGVQPSAKTLPGSQAGKSGIDQKSLQFKNQATSISSLYRLFNSQVTITTTIQQGGFQINQQMQYQSPLNDPNLVKTLAPLIFDKLKTDDKAERPARININTAPLGLLQSLPGFTSTDKLALLPETIVNIRQSLDKQSPDPMYSTPAWLLHQDTVPVTVDELEALDKYITARTSVYRVQSIGTFDDGGPAARVEAVIEIFAHRARILYYRDLSEFGKGVED